MQVTKWFDAVHKCEHEGKSYVLVTVINSAGSAPREIGAKMVVCGDAQFDTIGGGHLEFEAIAKARIFLLKQEHTQHIESYPLSSKLGQCCGGAVKLLFEVHVNHTQHLVIFGAGHVAKALVPILAQLPLQIKWIDSRQAEFDSVDTNVVNANVEHIVSDDPAGEIASLKMNSWVIVLTHNHQLDYSIVESCLKLNLIDYLGMIGSATKAKRFVTRLKHRGFSESQVASLVSPIGEALIPGKRPIEVAVSISAQIIQLLNGEKINDQTIIRNDAINDTIKAESRK